MGLQASLSLLAANGRPARLPDRQRFLPPIVPDPVHLVQSRPILWPVTALIRRTGELRRPTKRTQSREMFVCLLPSDAQRQQLEQVVQKHVGEDSEEAAMLRWICDLVAERKQRLYPHLDRSIFDVHFTRRPDDTIHRKCTCPFLCSLLCWDNVGLPGRHDWC